MIKKYLFIAFALAGSLLFMSLFGSFKLNIDALQFRVAVQAYGGGYTEVAIPPLGTVRAKTHATPVLINIRLDNIDPEALKNLLGELPERNELIQRGKTALKKAAVLFVLKLFFLAVIGGAFGVYIFRPGTPKKYAAGCLAGLLLAASLMTGTYYSYNTEAFRNPQYQGVLRMAPWMVNLAQETVGKLETLSEQMKHIASNLNTLYARVESLQPPDGHEFDFQILHISDLHNNPAGIDFALRIAELFKVDMIIDTGDISDFGTPLEAVLLDRLTRVKVPYLFIAGNHDSPTIVEKMASLPQVRVINGLIRINGILFYGAPDPASSSTSVIPPDLSAIPRFSRQIEAKLEQVPGGVDILLLHNNRMAYSLAGKAPLILFGHNHQLAVEQVQGSIMVDAGSTGAAGLRGLQAFKVPYSVALLRLKQTENGRPVTISVDSISVGNLEQGFTLEREVFNQDSTSEQQQ